MPTKRKGASKHRQSRRSRRHSRRSVRGAGKSRSFMRKPSSMNSSLHGITKPKPKPSFPTLEPSHAVNYVKNMPFKLIGIEKRSDLQLFTGNFQMKDGNAHYMPGGFVFWRGDAEAQKSGGWYQVKKFDPITNMPEGRAYRVHSPETPVKIKDTRGHDDFETFNFVAESGPAPEWHY